MTLRAELAAPEGTVVPGTMLSADLHVWNEGRIVDAYDLTLLAPPGEWGERKLGQLPVYPGMHEKIKIPITVPRSSDLRPGPVALGVQVTSVLDPSLVVVPEAEIDIAPFRDVEAELSRPQTVGRFSGSNLITLRNTGNAPVAVRLRTSPQDEKTPLRSRMRRSRVVLAVGERARVGVVLRAARPVAVGKDENWNVKITAEWDGEAVRERVFTHRRRPVLTTGGLRATMVLMAVVVAGAALWLSPVAGGTRGPRTQTAAGPTQLEQVNSAAAKARQQLAQEKQKNEQDEKNEKAKKAPKKRQLQHPLFVQTTGGSKESAYTVETGYRLQLTTVQITAAGNGTLLLSADGKPLGSVSLSQAKDITPKIPVTVPQGRTVRITVLCGEGTSSSPTALPSPSLSPVPTAGAATCAATALVTGELIPDQKTPSEGDTAKENER
ncbi:hypothetical protein [Streptomyces sp.]|uniref:COG1470 family protein n=1 Tax=Streptomyces sp. TaxID=1931 RepID=UPI002D784179|nr:hypothetical protein [Streptomyces sp.]HET6358875.1 hypothetical protein [Streptomyces sp.]